MDDQKSSIATGIVSEYLDDERVLGLALAVVYLNGVHANPNATPGKVGLVFETADKFIDYLHH